MNSYERMTRRLRGDPVDRPPNFNIMMTFAAHHVGQPLSRYYLDHRVLCQANCRCCANSAGSGTQAAPRLILAGRVRERIRSMGS